ncbi:hypothetical protein [Streptomyces parvulus]|uniref:hypothetical protein n=1 Tax=Streptomyces parvulus TaxID=146923 RepID=UPI003F4B4F15
MPREIRYFFDNPVALQVREEGRVEGRIEAGALMVLRILEWREIPVCFALRERGSTAMTSTSSKSGRGVR